MSVSRSFVRRSGRPCMKDVRRYEEMVGGGSLDVKVWNTRLVKSRRSQAFPATSALGSLAVEREIVP